MRYFLSDGFHRSLTAEKLKQKRHSKMKTKILLNFTMFITKNIAAIQLSEILAALALILLRL